MNKKEEKKSKIPAYYTFTFKKINYQTFNHRQSRDAFYLDESEHVPLKSVSTDQTIFGDNHVLTRLEEQHKDISRPNDKY